MSDGVKREVFSRRYDRHWNIKEPYFRARSRNNTRGLAREKPLQVGPGGKVMDGKKLNRRKGGNCCPNQKERRGG